MSVTTTCANCLGRGRLVTITLKAETYLRCKVCFGKGTVISSERTEKYLNKWEAGWTSSQISAYFGVSRNAVLGVIKRARDAGNPRAQTRPSPIAKRDERLAKKKLTRPKIVY